MIQKKIKKSVLSKFCQIGAFFPNILKFKGEGRNKNIKWKHYLNLNYFWLIDKNGRFIICVLNLKKSNLKEFKHYNSTVFETPLKKYYNKWFNEATQNIITNKQKESMSTKFWSKKEIFKNERPIK